MRLPAATLTGLFATAVLLVVPAAVPAVGGGTPAAASPGRTPAAVRDVPCGTTWAQPGGSGTQVTITFKNCTGRGLTVAPAAVGGAPDHNHYTYARLCEYVSDQQATSWLIRPHQFPPEGTSLQYTSRCL
ncbi:hypothetical protein [Streptomyces syringium]|uniref:hypothetical protein n=1 Tax=Streptomyces syringium TaxID=76729 RepID=UPI0033EB124D